MTHSRFVDKKLEVRAMLPGLRVEYSTDNGVTWNDVALETVVDRRVKLRTRYEFFSLKKPPVYCLVSSEKNGNISVQYISTDNEFNEKSRM